MLGNVSNVISRKEFTVEERSKFERALDKFSVSK